MKFSRWIYTICALALFSAHQTHRNDADKPDYSRSPAMARLTEPAAKPRNATDNPKAIAKKIKNSERHSVR